MYARIYLDQGTKIVGFFVISKNKKFTPRIPGAEFEIGNKMNDFKSKKYFVERLEEAHASKVGIFRERGTFYMQEVVISGKDSGWKQIVLSYHPLGYIFDEEDQEIFEQLVRNEFSGRTTLETVNSGRQLHANAYGVATAQLFTQNDNILPEMLSGADIRDFECD